MRIYIHGKYYAIPWTLGLLSATGRTTVGRAIITHAILLAI